MRKSYKYISLVLLSGLIILLAGFYFAKTLLPPDTSCPACYTSTQGYFLYQDVVKKFIEFITYPQLQA